MVARRAFHAFSVCETGIIVMTWWKLWVNWREQMLESGHSTAVLIFNLFVILVHKDGYYCVAVIFPLFTILEV